MDIIEKVKDYAHIEESDDIAQAYIESAEEYLTNAGVTKDETKALYCLAVQMLVTYWYDNRMPTGGTAPNSLGLGGIIAQLKYCKPPEAVI